MQQEICTETVSLKVNVSDGHRQTATNLVAVFCILLRKCQWHIIFQVWDVVPFSCLMCQSRFPQHTDICLPLRFCGIIENDTEYIRTPRDAKSGYPMTGDGISCAHTSLLTNSLKPWQCALGMENVYESILSGFPQRSSR